jgi:hypothetical protein
VLKLSKPSPRGSASQMSNVDSAEEPPVFRSRFDN